MMTFRKLLPFALLALAACSGSDVSNTLGLNKRAPDEFVVVSRPPLVVPPEFDLEPPRPGAEAPHAVSTEQQARRLLLGTGDAVEPAPGRLPGEDDGTMTLDEFMDEPGSESSVETAVTPVIASDAPTAASVNFLKKLGAYEANPSIRSELSQEIAAPKPEKEADSLYEEIMGSASEETILDPAKESERLRSNKDEGKPVTEGETPTKDTTPKSVIEKVF